MGTDLKSLSFYLYLWFRGHIDHNKLKIKKKFNPQNMPMSRMSNIDLSMFR